MANYNKETYRRYQERSTVIGIRLHKEKDKDIIDTLDVLEKIEHKSRQAWIKDLMRQYIRDHQAQLVKEDNIKPPAGSRKDTRKIGDYIYDFYSEDDKEGVEKVSVAGRVLMVVRISGLKGWTIYKLNKKNKEHSFLFRDADRNNRLEAYVKELNKLYQKKQMRNKF